MKICIVRHGETAWNSIQKIQGRKNIPLNKNGILQSIKCGEAIRKESSTWRYIISSPLVRARETANIIADLIGVCEVFIDNNLIERNYGQATGLTFYEYSNKISNNENFGIEDIGEVKKRIWDSINTIVKLHYPFNVVMVSHGGAIKALLNILGVVNLKHINNAYISLIEFKNGNFNVLYYNKSAHDILKTEDIK